ncbi:MAG: hypothetical protein ACLVJ6_04655 [Merdibacter sp.]
MFVDGGMSDNIRPALYQAAYACDVANRMNDPKTVRTCVAGKCCESGDADRRSDVAAVSGRRSAGSIPPAPMASAWPATTTVCPGRPSSSSRTVRHAVWSGRATRPAERRGCGNMRIPVAKYHGCGNDFVLVRASWVQDRDPAALARTLCERHTGIGADGLIIVKEDPLEMIFTIRTAAGRRCAETGFAALRPTAGIRGSSSAPHYAVQTLAGIQRVHVRTETPFQVEIDMGMPKEDRSLIGIASPIWGQKIPLDGGVCVQAYSLFMGTIHTVVFSDDPAGDAKRIGDRFVHIRCMRMAPTSISCRS